MKKGLKQFFKTFAVLIVIAVIACVTVALIYNDRLRDYYNSFYESPNNERVYGTKRVFDYGDRLTDKEEAALEAYIRVKERETCTDIVIVLLEESLEDFANSYYREYSVSEVPTDQWVRLYADDFWEKNKFGYDQPQILDGTSDSGDGVCLVDNNFREPSSGKKHTWMCTTGKAYHELSEFAVNSCLDDFYDYVDTDLYKACTEFVDSYVLFVSDYPPYLTYFSWIALGVAFVAALIFMGINLSTKVGKKTTGKNTYVGESGVEIYDTQDIFLRKAVTSRIIESDSDSGRSGGGGGGGHVSGGGGFHGGGGHSR